MSFIRKSFSREERASLHDLVEVARERELGGALEEIERALSRWREGELHAWEVSEIVHEFHRVASREILARYNGLPTDLIVSGARARKVLRPSEIPPTLLRKLDKPVR